MARPTKYAPEVVKKITDAIKLGATYGLACKYAGVSEDSFARWQKRYAVFADAVKEAEGAAAIGWLARIEKAAVKSWQAAAWKLERRYPEQYGRTVSDHRHKFDARKDAEAIAAEIGKADDPAVVAQIERDLLISQEAR